MNINKIDDVIFNVLPLVIDKDDKTGVIRKKLAKFSSSDAPDMDVLFEYFSNYCDEHFHFPRPIMVREKRNPHNGTKHKRGYMTRRRIDNDIMYWHDDCCAGFYYEDIATGDKYYSSKELFEAFGYNKTLFNREEETDIYRYFPEIDTIVGFNFKFGKSKNGLVLEELTFIDERYIKAVRDEGLSTGLAVGVKIAKEQECDYSIQLFEINQRGSVGINQFQKFRQRFNESFIKAYYKKFGQIATNIKSCLYTYAPFDGYNFYVTDKMYKEPTNGKKQKMIDSLCTKQLTPLSSKAIRRELKDEIFNPNNYWSSDDQLNLISRFERVNEDTSVLRFIALSPFGVFQEDVLRIYCVKDELYGCKKDLRGRFVPVDVKSLALNNFKSYKMLDVDIEDVKGTTFQYYAGVLNTLPYDKRSDICMAMIKNQRIEQLLKIGFKDSILPFISEGNRGINTLFNNGNFNTDAKDIFSFIGMNSKQFNYILDNYDEKKMLCFMQVLQKYFDMDNISSIDEITFENVVKAVYAITHGEIKHYHVDCLTNIAKTLREHDKKLFAHFNANIITEVPSIMALDNDYYTTVSIVRKYFDFLEMLVKCGLVSEFSTALNADDIESISIRHDEITAIYNLKKNEICEKEFMANVKKVKKYEYTPSKGEYVVVAPKEPLDLAHEGIELHHCVKSYIPKVADGKTNILFIRQKEDLEKPFFTVELDNDGIVQQVHGFANCNADTVPGLLDFVKEWTSKKKLKMERITKVR